MSLAALCRARLAAGIFERIAEWNGYGRALYPWSCGLDVPEPSSTVTDTSSGSHSNGSSNNSEDTSTWGLNTASTSSSGAAAAAAAGASSLSSLYTTDTASAISGAPSSVQTLSSGPEGGLGAGGRLGRWFTDDLVGDGLLLGSYWVEDDVVGDGYLAEALVSGAGAGGSSGRQQQDGVGSSNSCSSSQGDSSLKQLSRLVTIMSGASNLGITPKYFARPAERFELDDLDRYACVCVCVCAAVCY